MAVSRKKQELRNQESPKENFQRVSNLVRWIPISSNVWETLTLVKFFFQKEPASTGVFERLKGPGKNNPQISLKSLRG